MNNTTRSLTRLTAATAVSLGALLTMSNAQAQDSSVREARAAEQRAARQAMEPIFGVFVYERLDATPSLRLREHSTPRAAAPGNGNNAFGTFTYDALGATPRVSLPSKQPEGAANTAPRGE